MNVTLSDVFQMLTIFSSNRLVVMYNTKPLISYSVGWSVVCIHNNKPYVCKIRCSLKPRRGYLDITILAMSSPPHPPIMKINGMDQEHGNKRVLLCKRRSLFMSQNATSCAPSFIKWTQYTMNILVQVDGEQQRPHQIRVLVYWKHDDGKHKNPVGWNACQPHSSNH